MGYGYKATGRFTKQSFKRYSSPVSNRPATFEVPSWLNDATVQQKAYWDAGVRLDTHIILKAKPGSGKTSSSVEMIRRLIDSGYRGSIAFMAFGKQIAQAITDKLPVGAPVTSSTLHSHGNACLKATYPGIKVSDGYMFYMLDKSIDISLRNIITAVAKMVKGTLTDASDIDALRDMCADQDIQLGDSESQEDLILRAVPNLLADCLAQTTVCDFADMIWRPVVDKKVHINITRYGTLIIDEAQDLNPAQQQLSFMSGDRLMIVGDENQAIMAFTGADVDSMLTMETMLSATARKVTTLPLTVSQRCTKLGVLFARGLVEDFDYAPNAPDGHLCFGSTMAIIDPTEECGYRIVPAVHDDDHTPTLGDMIISRTNAPLGDMAMALIKKHIPVRILGRVVGEGLVGFIKKFNATDVLDLINKMDEYYSVQAPQIMAAKKNAEQKLQSLTDKIDTIIALGDGLTSVADVIALIESLFTDKTADPEKVVTLCTAHKSKGLESPVVWVMNPELFPHPMAKNERALTQEHNLEFVAETRVLGDKNNVRGTLHFHGCVAA